MRKEIYKLRRKLREIIKQLWNELQALSFFVEILFYKPCRPEELHVLILDSEKYPYNEIKNKGTYPTWVTDLKRCGVDFHYYYGDSKENLIAKEEIRLLCPDDAYTLKLLNTLKILSNQLGGSSYILRTNSSSYWRINYLKKIITYLKLKDIDYFGVRGYDYYGKKYFASGAGFILSPNAIEIILEKSELLDASLIDDVAVGHLMWNDSIRYKKGYRLNLNTNGWLIKAICFSFYHYHFRCKTKSMNKHHRLKDIRKMLFLHRMFSSEMFLNPIKKNVNLIRGKNLKS